MTIKENCLDLSFTDEMYAEKVKKLMCQDYLKK